MSRSRGHLVAVLCGALALRAATVRTLDGAASLAPLECVLAASMIAGSPLASTAPALSRHARRGIRFLLLKCGRAVAPWTRIGLAPRALPPAHMRARRGIRARQRNAARWWAVVTTLTHVWNARWGDVGLAALVTLGGAGSALLFVTQVRMPAVEQDFAYYFRVASNLATSLVAAGPGILLREGSLQERPPLYPLVLTGFFMAFGASPDVGRIGQALLHGLVPLLTYAGVRCFAGPGWAVLGALLATWHPHVFTAVSVLSYEHLQALTWLAATVWLWYTFQRQQCWHYAMAAILWAITALVKPYTLAGPVLLLGGLAGWQLRRRRGRLARGPLLFVAVFLLALVPWLVRSRLVYGEVVPVTPGVGLGVWAATLDQLPTNWSTDPRILAVHARARQTGRGANAAQVDRVFLEEALARIATDPWRALRTLTGRQLRDWLVVPHDMYTFYGSGPDDLGNDAPGGNSAHALKERDARWSLGLEWPQVQAAWAESGLLPRLSLLPLLDWASTQARRQHLALLALAVAGLGIALVRRDRAAVLAQLTPWCIFLTVWPTLAQNRYAVPFYPLFVLSAVYALACGPLLLPVRPAVERTEGRGLRTEPPRPLGRVILPTGRAPLRPQSAALSPEQSPQSSSLRQGAQAALLWLGTVLVLRSLAQTVALAFLQRGLPGP